MNDPHVVALLYDIEHDESGDYSREEPPEPIEEPEFRVHVEKQQARFEMKQHYASVQEARGAVRDYISAWEFSENLTYLNAFKLVFRQPKVVDRKPTPGVTRFIGPQACFQVRGHAELTIVNPRPYPVPPSTFKRVPPDAKRMYERFFRSRAGKEPLPSMAYFCLTALEASVVSSDQKRREAAAKKYNIEKRVLDKIGELSSKRGGKNDARKAYGTTGALRDITVEERRFLTEAIARIIYRMAETESAEGQASSQIRLAGLPSPSHEDEE